MLLSVSVLYFCRTFYFHNYVMIIFLILFNKPVRVLVFYCKLLLIRRLCYPTSKHTKTLLEGQVCTQAKLRQKRI